MGRKESNQTNKTNKLSYMTTSQLSYMGWVKYSFFPKKGIQRTNILRLSNAKGPSKVKRHYLTSLKVNDVIELVSNEDIANEMLTAQGA